MDYITLEELHYGTPSQFTFEELNDRKIYDTEGVMSKMLIIKALWNNNLIEIGEQYE